MDDVWQKGGSLQTFLNSSSFIKKKIISLLKFILSLSFLRFIFMESGHWHQHLVLCAIEQIICPRFILIIDHFPMRRSFFSSLLFIFFLVYIFGYMNWFRKNFYQAILKISPQNASLNQFLLPLILHFTTSSLLLSFGFTSLSTLQSFVYAYSLSVFLISSMGTEPSIVWCPSF